MTTEQLIQLAKDTAKAHQLDPALVCAIVEQESSWDTYAIRYEPGFYAKWVVPLKLTNPTDAYSRAFSWGLMQVMGQTAIESGIKVHHMAELCDPYKGLDTGCLVLAHKLKLAGGEVNQALLYWNGGSNLAYPAEVLARYSKYTSNNKDT